MDVDLQVNSREHAANTNQPLEQFLMLAKTARGAALRTLVEQVLEAPDVYVFGELLELACVQELEIDPEGSKYLKLLNIFTYGTYKDYTLQSAHLPPLSPLMAKKLRQLSIVSLAAESKYILYSTLLEELALDNIRELEDLLISAIYSNVVRGRLNQQNSRLEVDWTIGRDLRTEDVDYIIDTLSSWCKSCETMLQSIGSQVVSANTHLSEDAAKKVQINTEVMNILSTIKKASGQDLEMTPSDTRMPSSSQYPLPSSGSEVKPKKSKVKGLRGSGVKLWSSKN